MDKTIRTVLILATVFLVLILWMGLRNRKATSTAKSLPASSLEEEKDKLSPEELKKIDEALREIEEKGKGVTTKEAEALEVIKRFLEASKAEGRFVSPREVPPPPSNLEEEPLGPDEGSLFEPGVSEQFLPEDLPPEEAEEMLWYR